MLNQCKFISLGYSLAHHNIKSMLEGKFSNFLYCSVLTYKVSATSNLFIFTAMEAVNQNRIKKNILSAIVARKNVFTMEIYIEFRVSTAVKIYAKFFSVNHT